MEINKKISFKAREVNMKLRWKEGEDYPNGIGKLKDLKPESSMKQLNTNFQKSTFSAKQKELKKIDFFEIFSLRDQ